MLVKVGWKLTWLVLACWQEVHVPMDNEQIPKGFFVSLSKLTLRYRFTTLGLVGLAVLGMMFQIVTRGLAIDNSPEVFEAVGSRTSFVLSELREEFGQDQLFVVVVEGDVFSAPFLEKLDKLHQNLEAIDIDFEYVDGFNDAESAAEEEGGLDGFDDTG